MHDLLPPSDPVRGACDNSADGTNREFNENCMVCNFIDSRSRNDPSSLSCNRSSNFGFSCLANSGIGTIDKFDLEADRIMLAEPRDLLADYLRIN
jgi:hypothetical protein